MLPGGASKALMGAPATDTAPTLVEGRRGEAHSGVPREFLAAATLEIASDDPSGIGKAPPAWLEAEGARRSSATNVALRPVHFDWSSATTTMPSLT